jgi:hypothetical protein
MYGMPESKRETERASIDRAVADYYDSLSTEEATEQTVWAEFAFREFPLVTR